MSTQPGWSQPRLCAQCQNFGGWVANGAHVWCLKGPMVHADPWSGCVYWVRWVPKAEKAPLTTKARG